jgi:hypothetical protein
MTTATAPRAIVTDHDLSDPDVILAKIAILFRAWHEITTARAIAEYHNQVDEVHRLPEVPSTYRRRRQLHWDEVREEMEKTANRWWTTDRLAKRLGVTRASIAAHMCRHRSELDHRGRRGTFKYRLKETY